MHLHKNDLSTICSKENKFKWAPQTSLPRQKQELKGCRWECNNNMIGQPMGHVGPSRGLMFPHLGHRNGEIHCPRTPLDQETQPVSTTICKQKKTMDQWKIEVQPSQIIRGMKSMKKYSSRSFSRLAWCPWTSMGFPHNTMELIPANKLLRNHVSRVIVNPPPNYQKWVV